MTTANERCDWELHFISKQELWRFGHKTFRYPLTNPGWLIEAWCFGPFEWHRWSL